MKHLFLSSFKISKSFEAKKAFSLVAQSYLAKPEVSLKLSSPSKPNKEINESFVLKENETIKGNEQISFGLEEIKNLDNGDANGSNASSSRANTSSPNSNSVISAKHHTRAKDWRVTLLLTVVCFFFVLTEFPQSVLAILSILLDDWFYNDVYLPLGDLMDMFALINNSFMFILYCSMSIEFRETLVCIFKSEISK
jgi:hypothetical protein